MWSTLPHALGIEPYRSWWTLGILTLTGAAVGLVVWLVPGHAGPDSATTELAAPPLGVAVVPSLALATVISLAGGVSLGPENPIIAINTALTVGALARFAKIVPPQLVALLASAATVGALSAPGRGRPGVHRHGGGAEDRGLAVGPAVPPPRRRRGRLAHHLPPRVPPLFFHTAPSGLLHAIDFLTGTLVAGVTALLGIGASTCSAHPPGISRSSQSGPVHRPRGPGPRGPRRDRWSRDDVQGTHRGGRPDQDPGAYTAGTLAMSTIVKIIALLIAASAASRGGRIFPAVFVGVAAGSSGTPSSRACPSVWPSPAACSGSSSSSAATDGSPSSSPSADRGRDAAPDPLHPHPPDLAAGHGGARAADPEPGAGARARAAIAPTGPEEERRWTRTPTCGRACSSRARR